MPMPLAVVDQIVEAEAFLIRTPLNPSSWDWGKCACLGIDFAVSIRSSAHPMSNAEPAPHRKQLVIGQMCRRKAGSREEGALSDQVVFESAEEAWQGLASDRAETRSLVDPGSLGVWRPPLDSPTGRRKSTSKSRTALTMDALQRRPRFITWNQASQERRFLDKDHARQGWERAATFFIAQSRASLRYGSSAPESQQKADSRQTRCLGGRALAPSLHEPSAHFDFEAQLSLAYGGAASEPSSKPGSLLEDLPVVGNPAAPLHCSAPHCKSETALQRAGPVLCLCLCRCLGRPSAAPPVFGRSPSCIAIAENILTTSTRRRLKPAQAKPRQALHPLPTVYIRSLRSSSSLVTLSFCLLFRKHLDPSALPTRLDCCAPIYHSGDIGSDDAPACSPSGLGTRSGTTKPLRAIPPPPQFASAKLGSGLDRPWAPPKRTAIRRSLTLGLSPDSAQHLSTSKAAVAASAPTHAGFGLESTLGRSKPALAKMGNCLSSTDQKEAKDRSVAIDKQIEEDSRKFKKECKILLLGSGESGKSTIVKQMKIIHQNGYTKDELLLYRLTVIKNLVDSAQAIVLALRKFKMEPEMPENRENVDAILQYRVDADPGATLDHAMARKVDSLWKDPIIPAVMERGSEFYLMDSAAYFFDNVNRIGQPDYVPDENDVLRARSKTTGISETRFNMGQLSIHLFDVGGQRSERKKWIHCFEAVTSIIFCVALSEYDQVLLEESGQNRMAESLVLFESVVNSRWFLRTSIILFLNKIDIFKQKIPKQPLSKYFPEYSGGPDINKAAKYILWRFTQTNRARLSIYPHLTQATDTSNIRLVFAAVKETILTNALKDSGIL
ncbi:hypothetical protein PANT_11d00082 [Moesziomyces antarcticus T-34]|uniref:Guanine nucleotide-binding protein alpha-3 subunit n=1 Tax=Pseudozyma antarctica (strain T-34) TaxID=1151754 RepID=M9LW89_PSEA3|nr:hypothetical protein PANT_11d00082 [Moesziomyces antarcticus T-34]